jgi:hypothetical protein
MNEPTRSQQVGLVLLLGAMAVYVLWVIVR